MMSATPEPPSAPATRAPHDKSNEGMGHKVTQTANGIDAYVCGRLFGNQRGAEIQQLVEDAVGGPCPCKMGRPCPLAGALPRPRLPEPRTQGASS